jgi:hypothetical protein
MARKLSQAGFANTGTARSGATREQMVTEGTLLKQRPNAGTQGNLMPIRGTRAQDMAKGSRKPRGR